MSQETLRFGPTRKAWFIERPNRFLVRCRVRGMGVVEAFLPNPGRLWELLFPGATLHLVDLPPAVGRRSRYKVLAVERDGVPVFLDTHLTNQVARFLIERNRIPQLVGAELIRAEVPVGDSRFDFLLRKGRRKIYLEVKSCTLFGNKVAMFPDAVTDRGRRHLIELAQEQKRGIDAVVLFLVHTSKVRWFMPDYHTDLAFSQSLLNLRNKVGVCAVALEWRTDLSLAPAARVLEIPWTSLTKEVKDRGSYITVLRLKEKKHFQVGRLGILSFRSGFYLYVGSAMRNLSARMARHSRLRKKLRWHIDYLREGADGLVGLPIRSSRREECEIAAALSKTFEEGPPGFGSSDCTCPTHLFYSAVNPLEQSLFHEILQRFRMRPPGGGYRRAAPERKGC